MNRIGSGLRREAFCFMQSFQSPSPYDFVVFPSRWRLVGCPHGVLNEFHPGAKFMNSSYVSPEGQIHELNNYCFTFGDVPNAPILGDFDTLPHGFEEHRRKVL
jgi:hypothetical protein